jgi:membrane-bound lytic murein transglycosylase D
MRMSGIRFRWLGCAALAFLLAGCNPTVPAGASNGAQPQVTAPALAPVAAPVQAPPPAAPAPPTLTPEQQKTHTLIQQVEAAYAQGESDYHKGKLLEAKQQFDRAVDLMLASGIDIKNNSELQDEFDRIVDGVNALEMEALKQGNGFVPKEEETPAEAAEDVTFEVDPNIVAKAKADLATTNSDLPLVVNDTVAGAINFFANTKRGHNTLLHSFQRGGRYRAMIQRVMAEEGVPQDLIYLAVAESGFNPRAVGPKTRSGGRAGGMWQFMPFGNYGLVRNSYVDERFDPEKSTRAYARYMKFIYGQLGDWYLSMAGYDWGTGNVQRAVEKTGYADFWELYKRNNLPAETKNYVPEILAAIIIANHPTQYGFDDLTLDPPVLTDTVTINYPVSLRLVSDVVGAPVDELTALNPSLLRSSTPPDAAFDLHLPGGMAELYQQRIAAVPEAKRNSWRYHRVAADETLASVARTYHVAEAELAAANQLRASEGISGVEALLIPTPAAAEPVHARLYTVRKGDTLVTIADRFGVSLNELRLWNKVSGIKVQPGQRLRVAETASAPRASTHGHHRGAAQSEEHSSQAAPTKKAAEKSPSSREQKNRVEPDAKRSAPAARAKKSTSAEAKKAPARKRNASPKSKKTK